MDIFIEMKKAITTSNKKRMQLRPVDHAGARKCQKYLKIMKNSPKKRKIMQNLTKNQPKIASYLGLIEKTKPIPAVAGVYESMSW